MLLNLCKMNLTMTPKGGSQSLGGFKQGLPPEHCSFETSEEKYKAQLPETALQGEV